MGTCKHQVRCQIRPGEVEAWRQRRALRKLAQVWRSSTGLTGCNSTQIRKSLKPRLEGTSPECSVLSYFKLLSVQLLAARCMLPDGHLSFVKPSHSTLQGGVESASHAAICGHHTRPLRVPIGEGGRAAICESSRVQSNSGGKKRGCCR